MLDASLVLGVSWTGRSWGSVPCPRTRVRIEPQVYETDSWLQSHQFGESWSVRWTKAHWDPAESESNQRKRKTMWWKSRFGAKTINVWPNRSEPRGFRTVNVLTVQLGGTADRLPVRFSSLTSGQTFVSCSMFGFSKSRINQTCEGNETNSLWRYCLIAFHFLKSLCFRFSIKSSHLSPNALILHFRVFLLFVSLLWIKPSFHIFVMFWKYLSLV